MTMPTREQIDALVEAVDYTDLNNECGGFLNDGEWVVTLRRGLYLAAGLNADGSEKATAVRAVLRDFNSNALLSHGTWDGTTFTPDGAA